MATIPQGLDYQTQLLVRMIPERVLKSLSQDELADRIAAVKELRRLGDAETDQRIAKGYTLNSLALLGARPRAEVAREHDALITKAALMGAASPESDSLRRQAEALFDREPPAPRRAPQRAVAKTAARKAPASLPVGVYDARRRFAGLVDRSRIVQQVAKADGAEPLTPVFDQTGKLIGVCPPDAITPVTTDSANIAKAMVATPGKARRPGPRS